MTDKPNEASSPPEDESPSEVLRATHVLVILVEQVRSGDWMPEESGLQQRFVELGVRLEAVMKGQTAERPGDVVTICVQQRSTGTLRVMDDYGLWSKVDLVVGLKLVAFATSESRELCELLMPPRCELLLPSTDSSEVRDALDLEARGLNSARLLTEAVPRLEKGRGILARYVWARVRQAVLANETLFEVFAQLLERPATSSEARDVLLTAAHEELGLMAEPPLRQRTLLARAMLVLLAVPEAESLHANLAQVYLPNLVGLAQGSPRVSATEVLSGAGGQGTAALAALAAHPEWDAEGRLLHWLEESPGV